MYIPIFKVHEKSGDKSSPHDRRSVDDEKPLSRTNRHFYQPQSQNVELSRARGHQGHVKFSQPIQIPRYVDKGVAAVDPKVEDRQSEKGYAHHARCLVHEEQALDRSASPRLRCSTPLNYKAVLPNGQQWLANPQQQAPHQALLSIDVSFVKTYINPLSPLGFFIIIGFMLIFSGLAMWFGIICMRGYDRQRTRLDEEASIPAEGTSLLGTTAGTGMEMEIETGREIQFFITIRETEIEIVVENGYVTESGMETGVIRVFRKRVWLGTETMRSTDSEGESEMAMTESDAEVETAVVTEPEPEPVLERRTQLERAAELERAPWSRCLPWPPRGMLPL